MLLTLVALTLILVGLVGLIAFTLRRLEAVLVELVAIERGKAEARAVVRQLVTTGEGRELLRERLRARGVGAP